MGKLNDLLKKAGKGLVVTAASVLTGVTLGPLAAGAVGSFLLKVVGDIGFNIGQDIIEEKIKEKISEAPEKLMELAEPDEIEKFALSIFTDIDEVVRKGAILALGLSVSSFNIPKGVVLGEALFGNLPLVHDETYAAGIAAQNSY
jgi:hypothetical protein